MKFCVIAQLAPKHVANIIGQAKAGVYNNKIFHRVVSNFVIQGGDPDKTGWGDAGFNLRSEFNPAKFSRGTLGMPRSSTFDSESVQIFLNHIPTPHLDTQYTVFGQIIRGFHVLDEIEVGDEIVRAREFQSVRALLRFRILEQNAFRNHELFRRRKIMNARGFISLLFFSNFLCCFFPNVTMAEYRVFKLEIYRVTGNSSSSSVKIRETLSTLDQYQYTQYYHVASDQRVVLRTSWMCRGRTSQFLEPCPNPNPSDRPGTSAPSNPSL